MIGLQPRLVGGAPVLEPEALRERLRPASPHAPRASLVCAENTHNGAGGMVSSLEKLQAIRAVADEAGLPLHLDGARLWNASVATGTSLAAFAACAETVMVSFSKGLGAPVGAVLVGSARVMAKAWETRKRFGGGMRQSGILAAAGLYGLEHNLPHLHEDHRRAKALAAALASIADLRVVPPDTNIIMVDLPARLKAADVVAAARTAGVAISAWNASRIRLVLHGDIDDTMLATATARMQEVLQ
ncbi:MAG: hypothetical protein C0503_11895 [Gemmatimonas sp.]|nr:hypothetical protein [Gemmatimonas sp.]